MLPHNLVIPNVLEKDNGKERVFDIYSRLLKERVIFFYGECNQALCQTVTAQLLFLEAEDPEKDIYMYIDSPGGAVHNGLAVYDTMQLIKPDVQTICTGLAASMGSVMLAGGTKGKRHILPNAYVMVHQVSSGTRGTVMDQERSFLHSKDLNLRLHKLLADRCDKDVDEMIDVCSRDTWLDSDQSLEFGIVDKIVTSRGDK